MTKRTFIRIKVCALFMLSGYALGGDLSVPMDPLPPPGSYECPNFQPAGLIPQYTQTVTRSHNGYWGYTGDMTSLAYEFDVRGRVTSPSGRLVLAVRVNKILSNPGCQLETFFADDLVMYSEK